MALPVYGALLAAENAAPAWASVGLLGLGVLAYRVAAPMIERRPYL